jgi:transcriptional regulator with XRE-family HTH domain
MGMTLATYLEQHGIRPAQFAAKLGVPASTITRILSGARVPRIDTARKIAMATGGKVKVEDFGAKPNSERAA